MPAPPVGRLEAVLLDMDGTLVETESIWFAAEQEVVAELGGTWLPSHQELFVGGPLDRMITHMIALTSSARSDAEVHALLTEVMVRRLKEGPVPWMPGARELVDDLNRRGVPVALVSASLRAMVEAVTEHIGAEHFGAIVAGDDVAHSKPAPDPYLRAAALLGVDPTRCVAVEDSPTGLASARAAGCTVLAVPSLRSLEPGEGIHLRSTLAGTTAADLAVLLG